MDEEDWPDELNEMLSPEQRERPAEQIRIGWPWSLALLNIPLNWGMPSKRPFSDDGKKQLRELVSDSVISILEETSGVKELYSSRAHTNGESPRKYLKRLRRTLQRLDSVLDDATGSDMAELCGVLNRYREPPLEYPECVQKYIASPEDGIIASELKFFRRDVRLVLQLAEFTIENLKDSRGRKPSTEKGALALRIARICQQNNIAASKYEGSPYFQIVSIVFEDCFPGAGSESYRRYASEALDEYNYFFGDLDD